MDVCGFSIKRNANDFYMGLLSDLVQHAVDNTLSDYEY
jgi:hypothetical protein